MAEQEENDDNKMSGTPADGMLLYLNLCLDINYSHSFHTDFPWSIHNWPCSTDAAQSALPDMVNIYQVVPVPVYEFYGGLMYPTHYKTMLVKVLIEWHYCG